MITVVDTQPSFEKISKLPNYVDIIHTYRVG